MELIINDKKFNIRELLAIELEDINWEDKNAAVKKQVLLSTGLKEDEYNKLTVRERLGIIKAINEINGFNDFQNPAK